MDSGNPHCTRRACVAYIFTFMLLSIFFYELMANNKKSTLGILTLREDVDLLTQSFRGQGHTSKKFDCSGANPLGSIGTAGSGDSRQLTDQVYSKVKQQLDTLVNDVNGLKKQVIGAGCNFQNSAPSQAMTQQATRINYASDELGARIVHVLAKPIGGTNLIRSLLSLDFSANPPINMLRASISPGSCFGFSGSKATVSVRLAKEIIVEHISLTHVAKEMTPKVCVDNAPKDFQVYGLPTNSKKKEVIGQWIYDNSPGQRTQSYTVKNENPFRNIILVFSSNHGDNSTCVYRLEVFGRLP